MRTPDRARASGPVLTLLLAALAGCLGDRPTSLDYDGGAGGLGGVGATGGVTGTGGLAATGGVAGTGGTTPVCTLGQTRCVNNNTQVESCVSGAWGPAQNCMYACIGAACGGSCTPGEQQCSGTTA